MSILTLVQLYQVAQSGIGLGNRPLKKGCVKTNYWAHMHMCMQYAALINIIEYAKKHFHLHRE